MPKIIKNVAGQLTEEATVPTSAGAGSAGRVPELNGAGKLDGTLLNTVTTSAGVGDAGKLPVLDGAGRLDPTVLPTGVGADTALIQTSEALSAGDYVNVWNSGGARARKADASTSGKEAHGFVLTAVASGAQATVYFEGSNTAVTGQTPGRVYLDPANPGKGTATVPTTAGQVVQQIGFAISASSVNFQTFPSILLA